MVDSYKSRYFKAVFVPALYDLTVKYEKRLTFI